MRSRYCFALVALLIAVSSRSAAAQLPVQFGVMGGASFAKWHGSDVQNATTRTGFAGGIFLRLTPPGIFAVEPQLLYVQKGSKFDAGGGISGTVKVDYIEVPVLVKLQIATADKFLTPNIFAGPAIAFKASCRLEGDNGSGSIEGGCGGNQALKSTDFSLVLGAGLDVRRLSFQGRYDLGLQNLANDINVKSGAFLLTVGFAL